jgi:voltage-gated potassium channel
MVLSKLIVKFAFFLNGFSLYQNSKKLLYNLLQNPDYPYKKYLDVLMIFLILTSVAILVYGVRNPIPKWMDIYDIYLVTFCFLIEYLLRFWVHNDFHKAIVDEYKQSRFLTKKFSVWVPIKKTLKGKLEYITSLTAIVDLLAILPAYRPLRILRIFVLFRVFKLLRYTKSIKQFVEVLSDKKFELFTLLLLLVFIVLTAGIALYVFEDKQNENIVTLFDAFYWALVTISSVGYGDISPVTQEGRAISMLIILSGIAMIAFVTSVIVSAFSEKLDELKENRVVDNINKQDEFLIICGYGQMTKVFLEQEQEIGCSYIIIEKDRKKVDSAIKSGYNVIHGDASKYEVFSRFNVNYSNITLLCLTNSDIENIYITLNAKSVSKNIRVIARATEASMEKKFRLAGVDHVLIPNKVTSIMLLTSINQPIVYNGIRSILMGQDAAHVDELRVEKRSKLVGKKVGEIDFKLYKILLIGIERDSYSEFIFNPKSDKVIEEGDTLVMMGRKISVEYFKERLR